MLKSHIYISFLVGTLFCSGTVVSQEDLVSREEMLVEQQQINFQTFFFEALQQKAIGNYDKAVYALEACKDIEKDNVAVLFELSKNYYFLIKYTEAEYFVLKGLEIEPDNIHMLRHLKEVKTKQNDYSGAIKVQQKIVRKHPEEEAELVILYIKSGDIENATILLKKLDSANKLPEGLVALKDSLLQDGNKDSEEISEQIYEEIPKNKVDLIKEEYDLKKDYTSLKILLEEEWKSKRYLELLDHSKEGLSLYPSQPFLYLMNGKALNSLRRYQQAELILQEGIEYIIDDDILKVSFYEELGLSHKAMGNNKKAVEFYNKANTLKSE
jgi:tetratricopeptide (TPR) repeat protein